MFIFRKTTKHEVLNNYTYQKFNKNKVDAVRFKCSTQKNSEKGSVRPWTWELSVLREVSLVEERHA